MAPRPGAAFTLNCNRFGIPASTHTVRPQVNLDVEYRLGFYDMSGHVGEWCWDLYDPEYDIAADGTTDPRGPAANGGTVAPIDMSALCVVRGAYDVPVGLLRNAKRFKTTDTDTGLDLGFRVDRNP